MYAYFLSVKQSDASFCPSHKKNKKKNKETKKQHSDEKFRVIN